MSKKSKVQLQVLNLYKHFLKVAKTKPGVQEIVSTEFRKNAQIPRTDIMKIEYLLRQGNRKLKMIDNPFVTHVGKFVK